MDDNKTNNKFRGEKKDKERSGMPCKRMKGILVEGSLV